MTRAEQRIFKVLAGTRRNRLSITQLATRADVSPDHTRDVIRSLKDQGLISFSRPYTGVPYVFEVHNQPLEAA